ncbi:MAG: tagaturonate reductase, partial [Lachnospiraceae bacterium]|nr:tagaturonate reductase [Lachnospiraceae bacterium]
GLICVRPAGNEYKVQDDAWVLDFYFENKDLDDAALVKAVLSNEKMWDTDLTKIEGLYDTVLADLTLIRKEGAKAAYASVL